MSDMPMIDENNSNYVKLPYTLTKGVTATREGLVFDGVSDATHIMHPAMSVWPEWDTQYGEYFLSWPDAAERLRYREGEPWCRSSGNDVLCIPGEHPPTVELGTVHPYERKFQALHRLAAILCDDADAFRVLHWCVTELGGHR